MIMDDWFPEAITRPMDGRLVVPELANTRFLSWRNGDKPDALRPLGSIPTGMTKKGIDLEWRRVYRKPDGVQLFASFPPSFEFAGDTQDALDRIGNSVPPLMMRAIAGNIRSMLNSGVPVRKRGSLTRIADYPAYLEQAWQEHLAPREQDAPTVVSTFAGAGGSSLGYSMAGFRELLAVEWDNNAVETFKLNFPDVPVYHGDIAKLSVDECLRLAGLEPGQLDVFDGSPPCFPAGSQVMTLCGRIPIEFCAAGTEVLTHAGQFKEVSHTMTRKYSGQLYTIETKYGRRPVTCTPEHPLWARRRIEKLRDNRTRKNSTRYKAYDDPQWIAAKDLVIGDVICEPHATGKADLLIPKVVTKQRINRLGVSGTDAHDMQLLERDCSIDWRSDSMAWILGFYIAEGHTRGHDPVLEDNGPCRREVVFSVADKEAADIAIRLSDIGFHASVQRHSQGSSRVSVASADFWALCQTVGKYAYGKFIPTAFLCMPVAWQSQFLNGYFAGDGCIVTSKRIHTQKQKATTVSWDVALGIAQMVARVHEVVASIEIIYPAGVSIIQGRDVEVKEAYSVGYTLTTSTRVRPGFVDEQGSWLPIKRIDITDASDIDVYNLEVDGDNSYTVEGVAVHNCQGFSTAGKRNFDDSRNQLFREYVRLLRGLRPKVFVMENVSGMVKGKMKLIFADILRELKASGYRVSARLLNAMWFGVPQSRARMIFVGVREDFGLEPSHPQAMTEPQVFDTAVSGIVQDLPMPPVSEKHAYPKMLKTIQPGQSIGNVYGKGFNWIRIDGRQPCPTISKSTTYGGLHFLFLPDASRSISGREAARCAGYPDSVRFAGTYQDVLARIGNSVPPLFMRAIVRHIRREILDKVCLTQTN